MPTRKLDGIIGLPFPPRFTAAHASSRRTSRCSRAWDIPPRSRRTHADWIAAYKKYFRTDAPLQAHARPPIAWPDDDALTYTVWRSDRTPPVRLMSLSAAR